MRTVVKEERQNVPRVDGKKHRRVRSHREKSQKTDYGKPHYHYGAKHLADCPAAAFLEPEEKQKHGKGNGHDVRRKRGRGGVETFNRAEHRNHRRYKPVSIQERRTEQAEKEN